MNHSGDGRARSRAIDFAIPRPVPTTVAETDDPQMAIRWDVSPTPEQIYSQPRKRSEMTEQAPAPCRDRESSGILCRTTQERRTSEGLWKDFGSAPVHDADVDVFRAVTDHWRTLSAGARGRATITAWAQRRPRLSRYRSPSELVAAINQLRHPDRSCALLSDLLVIAEHDPLAQLAILVALIPGIRNSARRRWKKAATSGAWSGEGDIAADAMSAAWQAIRDHAGRAHPYPARLVIRRVERHLRTAHQAQLRSSTSTSVGDSDAHDIAIPADPDDAEHIVVRTLDAVRSGQIEWSTASAAFGVAIAGRSPAAIGRRLGLSPAAVQDALRRSHHVIAGGRPQPRPVPMRSGHRVRLNQENFPMLPLLLTINQAAELLGLGRSTTYRLVANGELHSVSRGTSRRVPLWSIYDYLDRLCERRYRSIPLPAVIDFLVRASDQQEPSHG